MKKKDKLKILIESQEKMAKKNVLTEKGRAYLEGLKTAYKILINNI